MCLIKKHKWPKITLQPKIVYKVLSKRSGMLFTPYRDNEVKLNKEYRGVYNKFDTLFTTIKSNSVNSGFIHSYKDRNKAMERVFIGNVVVICVIPSFTLYFEGVGGEIASRNLIYKNIIYIKPVDYLYNLYEKLMK